jgi:hypothetical protein
MFDDDGNEAHSRVNSIIEFYEVVSREAYIRFQLLSFFCSTVVPSIHNRLHWLPGYPPRDTAPFIDKAPTSRR